MKPLKIILCFLILLSAVSCGKNEFMNIYSFTESFNEQSETDIELSDFRFQKDSNNEYTAFLDDSVLLTLKCGEGGGINEINLSLIKDKSRAVTQQQTDCFKSTLTSLINTYCDYGTTETESVISAFGLEKNESYIKEGELTLKKDNFYFVYYSTASIGQIMIYNTYIYNVEATDKPVSKPYYAEDFIIKETP